MNLTEQSALLGGKYNVRSFMNIRYNKYIPITQSYSIPYITQNTLKRKCRGHMRMSFRQFVYT